jgi:flagellar motor switch protein FliM
MSEKTLTQDELRALLDSDEVGGKNRDKQVSDYDFAHPNHLSSEQRRILQRLYANVANHLAASLSNTLRSNVKVQVSSLGEQTFASFRSALPKPTMINILSVPPLQERALLTMEMKLAASLIDRMLGGPGRAPAKVRDLTKIERGLLDYLSLSFFDAIATGWRTLAAFTPALDAVEMDPQAVEDIPSAEALLVATFTIGGGEMDGGEFSFCIPIVALDGALGRLEKPVKFVVTKRPQTPEQRKQIDQVINQGTLDLEVVMGTTTLSIGDVMAIKPGDVLVLDQGPHDLLEGRVSGRLCLLGRPGRLGKKLCVVVEKLLPAAKPITKKE